MFCYPNSKIVARAAAEIASNKGRWNKPTFAIAHAMFARSYGLTTNIFTMASEEIAAIRGMSTTIIVAKAQAVLERCCGS